MLFSSKKYRGVLGLGSEVDLTLLKIHHMRTLGTYYVLQIQDI